MYSLRRALAGHLTISASSPVETPAPAPPSPLLSMEGYPISGQELPWQFQMPRPSEQQRDEHRVLVSGAPFLSSGELYERYEDLAPNACCEYLPLSWRFAYSQPLREQL